MADSATTKQVGPCAAMNFDREDDEFIPFAIREEVKDSKKKKFNTWLGEEEEDDDAVVEVPAHLRFVDESGGMFIKAGGLGDQLKPKKSTPVEKSAKKAKQSDKKAVVKDKGKFGVGLSMLEKMGWTGEGLGKNGTGITEALQVKQRPHAAGLGMIDEKTEAQKRVERQRRGEEVSDSEDDEETQKKEDKSGQKVVDRTQRWKKSAVAPKVQVKSAYDVLREEASVGSPQNLTVIDLTGEKERVVTDAKMLYEKERTVTDYKMGLGKELRYNVDKLLDMAEVELKRQGRSEAQLQKKADTFGSQARGLAQSVADSEARLAQLKEAEQLVGRLVQAAPAMAAAAEASDEAMGSLVVKLNKAFEGARTRFGAELYASLQLPDLLYGLLEKALTLYFARSDYERSPERGRDMAVMLKGLLATYQSRWNEQEEAVDYWILLQTSIIVPPLRAYLVRSWDCKNRPHVAVNALATWSSVLDEDVNHFLLHRVVWPKLLQCVEVWDPFTDSIPLHEWLHPWLPSVAREMEQVLYPIIVGKLVLALSEWEPQDGSAHALLQPWRNCFTASQLETVSQSRLLPKLASFLSASFRLSPGRQDESGALEAVLVWHDWIPSNSFVKLLARSVFPRIYSSAYQWVVTEKVPPSGLQIVAWYRDLKSRFPAGLFANQKVSILFAHLLDVLLNVRVARVVDFKPEILLVDLWADEREEVAVPKAASHLPLQKPVVSGSGADALSFRAMVEAFASERGILFVPLPNRKTADGKPVYAFGGVPVHFANQLVYAEVQAGAWSMMSLEHLAQMVSKSDVD